MIDISRTGNCVNCEEMQLLLEEESLDNGEVNYILKCNHEAVCYRLREELFPDIYYKKGEEE